MASFGTSRVIDANPAPVFRLVGIGVLFFLVLITVYAAVAYVPPGHVGVLTSFGRVTGEVLPEGTHFVSPFKINHTLTIRTQSQEEHTSTPSSEGLNLEIDTSLIYHLNPDKAADVFRSIGSQYAATIVEPTLRSVIRDTTAGHSANTMYSSSRKQVEDEIKQGLQSTLEPRGIVVENI